MHYSWVHDLKWLRPALHRLERNLQGLATNRGVHLDYMKARYRNSISQCFEKDVIGAHVRWTWENI